MNTRVEATGMSIKAQVQTQLLIKGSATGAVYKSAISFTDAADSAKSVSNNSLTTVPAVSYKLLSETGSKALIDRENTWLKLTPAASAYVDASGRMFGLANGENYDTWPERITDSQLSTPVYYQPAVANSTSAATGDYIKDTFTLKLTGAYANTTDTIAVTITATTNDSDFLDANGNGNLDTGDKLLTNIYKAIHIAFTWGSDGYKEFDLGSATPTYTTSAGKATITLGGTSEWLNTFTAAEEEAELTVYIWYDGEDADCMNSNANRIDAFTYDFEFELGAGA